MLKSKAMKWVKALRSGKYKQGTGYLRGNSHTEGYSYCCLGVLAEIEGHGDKIKTGKTENLGRFRRSCGLASTTGVPENSLGVRIKGHCGYESLADANDSGVSFKRIATWIEKNYKLL